MSIISVESLTFGLSKIVEAAGIYNQKIYLLTLKEDVYFCELQNNLENLVIVKVNTYNLDDLITAVKKINEYDPVIGIINPTDTFFINGIKLANYFNLKTIDLQIANIVRNKNKLRKLLHKHNLSSDKPILVNMKNVDLDYLQQNVKYPSIIKDNSGTGSRNVYLINNFDDLNNVLRTLNESDLLCDSLTIEEYFIGTLYSAEVISWKNEHKILAISGRKLSNEPFFKEEMAMLPVIFPENIYKKIDNFITNVLNCVGYNDSFSHIEFIITKDSLEIVEINPRLGGVLIGYALCNLLDTNIYEAFISYAINEKPKLFDKEIKYKLGYNISLLYADKKGVFNGFSNTQDLMLLLGSPKLFLTSQIGDNISNLDDQRSCVGIMLTSGETSEIATLNAMSNLNKIKILIEED